MNLDVPEPVIAAMEKSHTVPIAIEWSAPRDGIVLQRNAVEGMRAQPGDVLFRVADTSVVWAMVDVAERDLGAIAVGQPVTVKARSFPGREFQGKISVVYPQVNRETRTARVRIEFPNPDGACCRICMSMPRSTPATAAVLAIPDSAVLDTGSNRQFWSKRRGPVRAARRKARPSWRRLRRNPGGRRRGRARRHFRKLPDRCREQPEGGARRDLQEREASHDRPPHCLVSPQPAAGAVRRRLRRSGRHLRADPSAARCHSGSLRHAGDRLYRRSRPGSAGDRGPGHLSADNRHADRAAAKVGTGFLLLRRVVRLRHLRGRDRYLLGAFARARVS